MIPPDLLDLLNSVSTLVLAIFTIVLAIATIYLALANRALVRGADETAKRQLRAYVFTRSPSVTGLRSRDGIKATCKLENFGQTPAYGVTCASTLSVMKYPPGTVIVVGGMGPVSQLDLGPRGVCTIRASHRALSDDEIAEIRSGKKALYLNGAIAYTDCFKRSQSTEFMLMKNGDDLDSDSMDVCPVGNKAT
jgi:hypothetical protein